MTSQESQRLYSQVDKAEDPQALVDHMDQLRALDPFREVKERNFGLLNLEPGASVLDVGCGPGDDVHELARAVGADGRAVGVDRSETMISEAGRRFGGPGLPVEFHVMDAANLDFPNGTFDGVRADRVLQHVEDPAEILREMIRVTRIGGTIAVSDTDWGMAAMDLSERETTRTLVALIFDRGIRSPWIGRQLWRLFREAGLLDIQVVPHAIVMPSSGPPPAVAGRLPERIREAVREGLVSEDRAASWQAEFDERRNADALFMAIGMFTVAGRKP